MPARPIQTALLKNDVNSIFLLIRDSGLSPSDFVLKYGKTESKLMAYPVAINNVEYRGTQYQFWWKQGFAKWQVTYTPGPQGAYSFAKLLTWDSLLEKMKEWLVCLRKEVESPDLWKTISADRVFSSTAARSIPEDSAITAEEQDRIVAGLRELREFLERTVVASEADRAAMVERLDYLASAARRLNRKDWINVALGVLASLVINLSMGTSAARELLTLAGQTFRFLLRGAQLLP